MSILSDFKICNGSTAPGRAEYLNWVLTGKLFTDGAPFKATDSLGSVKTHLMNWK
jgi:hypothetical protein